MTMLKVVTLVSCVLVYSIFKANCGEHCAWFEIEPSTKLKAKENEPVSITYKLDTSECDVDDFNIFVSKRTSSTNYDHLCTVVVKNGLCRNTHDYTTCSCLPNNDGYLFKKTLKRSDNGSWVWWTSPNIAKPETVYFDVHYPAEIMAVTLTDRNSNPIQGPVNRSSFVNITCSFTQGNPPDHPYLFGHNNRRFDTDNVKEDNMVSHVIPRVTCEDAGVIHCKAPKGSGKKSVALAVRCPIKFAAAIKEEKISVSKGTEVDLKFPLKTHSIHGCTLQKLESSKLNLTSKQDMLLPDCWSRSNVSGIPPDLSLTVHLEIENEAYDGKWRIVVWNDLGKEFVDFWLLVTDEGDAADKSADETMVFVFGADDDPKQEDNVDGDDHNGVVVGTTISVLFVALIIIIVIVFVIYKLRGRCWRKYEEPMARNDDPGGAMVLGDGHQRAYSQEEHDYGDIPEVYPDEAVAAAENPYEGEYIEPISRPSRRSRPDTGTYDVTNTAYSILNPVYSSLQHVYQDMRQRVSRRFSRQPHPEVVEDPNVY